MGSLPESAFVRNSMKITEKSVDRKSVMVYISIPIELMNMARQ
jgi:hypothetical protein